MIRCGVLLAGWSIEGNGLRDEAFVFDLEIPNQNHGGKTVRLNRSINVHHATITSDFQFNSKIANIMFAQLVYRISCGMRKNAHQYNRSSFLVVWAPRCPSCQQPISKDKIVNDKNLQKEIQNLEVYCSNRDKGCDWDGTLRDFQVHLETCGFIVIECPNECGVKFERRFMSKHQNEDCPQTNGRLRIL